MKQILFLLNTLLICTGLLQAQTTSNLVVFSENGNPFYLIVNGVKQNTIPQTNIKITGLSNPSNSVLVIYDDKNLGTAKQNFYFQEMGVEVTGKITQTKKGFKIRYFGEVPISESKNNPNQYTVPFQNIEPLNQTNQVVTNPPVEQPVINNNQPQNNPVEPVVQPVQPVQPTVQPVQPTVQPVQPTVQPVQPAVQPTLQPAVQPNTATSVNMNYRWVAGKSYKFSVNQVDDVNTSVMGMTMKDKFTTKTEFDMYINSVAANGEANGTLYLIDFNVTDSRGAVMATVNDLPVNAVRSDFKVDVKGNFVFLKKITLITTAQGNILAYANADDNSVQMGTQAGEFKVEAYAEFDPKTGNLKSGYTLRQGQQLVQLNVKADENTDMIEVLPYDYLSMLALPEAAISQGDMAKITTGIYTIDILAKSVNSGVALMNYKMSSDKSKNITDGSAEVKTQNSSMMMDMPMQNMMELTDEDKQAMDIGKAMMPNLTCDFDSYFNYNEGMFSNVKGIMTTTINAMGMKMEVISNLDMRKL
jgi:hypothetical protein